MINALATKKGIELRSHSMWVYMNDLVKELKTPSRGGCDRLQIYYAKTSTRTSWLRKTLY